MSNVTNVTDDTFEEKVLNAPTPVLVDFYADWCGPCKAMMPSIADLAREFEGEAQIYKLDIDANPQVKDRYGIRGVPSFMLFKGGELVTTIVGTASRSKLALTIETALGVAQ